MYMMIPRPTCLRLLAQNTFLPASFALLKRRKQLRSEDVDDGYYDQQLDQRKSTAVSAMNTYHFPPPVPMISTSTVSTANSPNVKSLRVKHTSKCSKFPALTSKLTQVQSRLSECTLCNYSITCMQRAPRVFRSSLAFANLSVVASIGY